jgi:dUTP pyrophosphatase
MNLAVKIKKLSKNAVIPTYKHASDAGFDLSAAENLLINPSETVVIDTGLAFEIPEGYEMQIRPRSGLTSRTPLRVHLGTIDSGYHGSVGVIMENRLPASGFDSIAIAKVDGTLEGTNDYVTEMGTFAIHKGDRIAQAVIAPVVRADFEEVDELGDSERGAAGFGSTGVNANA